MTRNPLHRAALVLTLVCLAGLEGFAGPQLIVPPATHATATLPTFSHILVIIMENQGYSDIVGSPQAPFINTVLIPQYASATNMYAARHNSPTSYFDLSSGRSYAGGDGGSWAGSCDPALSCSTADTSLYQQLTDSGRVWKVYSEDQQTPCQTTYVAKYWLGHNPALFYQQLGPNSYISTGNGTCQADDVPYGQFKTDIAAGTVPDLAYIIPNNCDNMHDVCAPTNNQIRQGDNWLNSQLAGNGTVTGGLIPWALAHDTLLLVTFDESNFNDTAYCCPYASTGGGGHMTLWAIGPPAKVKSGGYQSTVGYNLYSVFKTEEENWAFPLLYHANDASVQDLSDFLIPGSGTSATPTATVPASSTPTATVPGSSTATATAQATGTSPPTATPKATGTSQSTATPQATITPQLTATPQATITPQLTATPPASATPQSALNYQREAEAMTRVGTTGLFTDPTASGGEAIKAWTSGSGVSDTVIVPSSGSYTFSFVGREDYYGAGTNTHAHVSLYLDGSSTPAAGVFVTNASGWVSYSLSTTLSAGTHTFALLFDNDAYGGSPSTDRNAYFDVVTISGGTGATPTNTATPVPSASATKTATASRTATSSATPTDSPSATATARPSITATNTATASVSPTGTATATNTVAEPSPTALTTPVTLFSDGFESGSFGAWQAVKIGGDGAAAVQTGVVKTGKYAAQLTQTANAGSYAYANATLPTAHLDMTGSGDFDVTTEGASDSNVRLFRLLDGAGNLVAGVFRQNVTGQLGVQYGGVFYDTAGTIPINTWVNVSLHVAEAGGGTSSVQVLLNSAVVYQTATASIGGAGVVTDQIGNSTASQASNDYIDNVVMTSTD